MLASYLHLASAFYLYFISFLALLFVGVSKVTSSHGYRLTHPLAEICPLHIPASVVDTWSHKWAILFVS